MIISKTKFEADLQAQRKDSDGGIQGEKKRVFRRRKKNFLTRKETVFEIGIVEQKNDATNPIA